MKAQKTKTLRVLVTEPEAYSQTTRGYFPESWDVTFADINDQEQLIQSCSDTLYDIVLAKLGLVFDRNLFELQPKLQVLATPTTGLNHIDLSDADSYRIQVISLRGETEFLSSVTSTAEHAWALLLALNRSLMSAVSRVSSGSWKRQGMEVHELSGGSLGIIGMGRLGTMVARYGLAFQMKVVGCDPHVSSENFPVSCRKVDLQELLASSEYMVMLAAYKPGDRPIIGKEEFDCLRPGAMLINVARGELIDEIALIRALDDGKLRAFGTDVLVGDSCWSSSHSFRSEIVERSRADPRVMVTPHMGGYAAEAIEKTRQFLIKKLRQHLEKREP